MRHYPTPAPGFALLPRAPSIQHNERVRLNGKTVLISGAGPGMGRATALLCAQEGAAVFIVARRSEHLTETLNVIRRLNTPAAEAATAIQGDVSNADDAERIVRAARDGGGGHVDVLYGGGGFFDPTAALSDVDSAFWRQAIGNTMEGPSNLARAAQPVMKQQGGGSIIFITASESVQRGSNVAYGAAKAGVIGLARNLARELWADNIRVNVVAPGLIRTRLGADADGIAVPDRALARRGHVSDVAHAALYFASDESAWVTGQVLAVDGGVDAGGRGLWDMER